MSISTKVTGWPVYALASVLASCIAGCSSGNGSEGSQGTFNDGPVVNLDFEVGGTAGKTGSNGSFSYGSPSDQITFSVGDIVLGSATVKSFMTPVDLVPGAVDENDDTVTNIARFLQTLDSDANLTNGIQIPEGAAEAAAGLSVNFAQTPEAFENDANVQTVLAALTTNALVPAENARMELRNTILVQLAGTYGGSFTGDGTGCWSFVVDDGGGVTGTFDVESSDFTGQVTLALTGAIPSSGAFTLTGSMPPFMLTIVGTATVDGNVTGNWTVMSDGTPIASGTFTGGKDQPCRGLSMDVDCRSNGARFEFTPFDASESIIVCPRASFTCQTPIGGGCELQVFDIGGEDRFFQFVTTSDPFMVNISFCGGFDFVVDEPDVDEGAGRGLSSAFGDLTGRQFGTFDPDNPTPFAAGDYAYRDGQLSGMGGESLGTFEFYEEGFVGFDIPVKPCP